jgi:hypothetical protein
MALGWTLLVTTDPAPIIAFCPTISPGRIVEVIARLNLNTGEVENLEVIFFDAASAQRALRVARYRQRCALLAASSTPTDERGS